VGCGGKVAIDGNNTTNTGGAGGSGGSGGAPPMPKICGGKQGFQCGADEWCQWDPPGTCGGFDNSGTCQPKPGGCTADCPGVCGCDGAFYCNECDAHNAGVDVSANGICGFMDAGGPDPEYAAITLPTNAPRYVITKTEHAADRCVLIFMVGFGMSTSDIQTTMGWGVERILITPHAKDCMIGSDFPPPPPDAVQTDIAKGSIKQDKSDWPCWVSVDVSIVWPPGSPAWVPAEETLQADQLIIQGGGCAG
jgi:hypothetical protein